MIDIAKLKEWADDFEQAAKDKADEAAEGNPGHRGARLQATVLMTRAEQVREEIANMERMERVDGSIAKRLSENISHNIELRAGLERIKAGLSRGKIGEDVVWFDTITTLWDFCDQLLNRRVPHDQSAPTTAERLKAFRENAQAFVKSIETTIASLEKEGDDEVAQRATWLRVNVLMPWQAALRDDETGDLWPSCEICGKPIKDEADHVFDAGDGLHFHTSCTAPFRLRDKFAGADPLRDIEND